MTPVKDPAAAPSEDVVTLPRAAGVSARQIVRAAAWILLDAPVVTGDCAEVMRTMPDWSVDAVVCDPPYALSMMGEDWDTFGRHREYSERQGYHHSGVLRGHGRGSSSADREAYHRRQNLAFQEWCEAWASEALRVLKPGGHILAFGGSRTYHRLTCAFEDAGFEIRDCLMWIYGSGFPKSRDVSKAIDEEAGAVRKVVGRNPNHRDPSANAEHHRRWNDASMTGDITAPATPDAERWEGWGSALKPSWEPVIVARKPLNGTLAGNVLRHGTGGVNVAGCRLGTPADKRAAGKRTYVGGTLAGGAAGTGGSQDAPHDGLGRWPANLAMTHSPSCRMVGLREVASNGHHPAARPASGYGSDVEGGQGGLRGQDGLAERHTAGEMVEAWECEPGCPVRLLDDQSGELVSGANPTRRNSDKFRGVYSDFAGQAECVPARGADRGGASRFVLTTPSADAAGFRYVAKAGTPEREAGLFGKLPCTTCGELESATHVDPVTGKTVECRRNMHPTVKPIELMRWLVRLVTPPGGIVLDPFCGSGTTGCAASLEGFTFLGIDQDPTHAAVAATRINWWATQQPDLPLPEIISGANARKDRAASGQASLFEEAA